MPWAPNAGGHALLRHVQRRIEIGENDTADDVLAVSIGLRVQACHDIQLGVEIHGL